ncbi:MAG: 4-hydroxythreonine-4-phosphate dehydrogenase PdxA [Myxococcales bacterium]|nr:4-hydroxythreonine-4-phosphate dehydrogenase PdxA [Myxococcales bacterium]
MGDPAGVGPEVICGALARLSPEQRETLLVVGDRATMERANVVTQAGLRFVEGPGRQGDVQVVNAATAGIETVKPGLVSAAGGAAAFGYIEKAVQLAQAGLASTLVTAPLNKAALHEAGHKYDGHTGLLQALTKAPSSFMLLAGDKLSTIHVSTHVSLEEAIRRVRPERVLATIEVGVAHFKRLGVANPRIAVAGLNPHAGEGGLFGDQESSQLEPAIAMAKAKGIEVRGPMPPDSVFLRAAQGEFDLVVAMYHDQGHIPTKLLAFDRTVNVSLGLPIDRTSVDHGTAFDIAWKNIARPENMVAAIEYAWRLEGYHG